MFELGASIGYPEFDITETFSNQSLDSPFQNSWMGNAMKVITLGQYQVTST